MCSEKINAGPAADVLPQERAALDQLEAAEIIPAEV
jgi:hypothetical protein